MHGGLNLSELRALGLRPDQVLDFSASINPLGASPLVREALQRVDLAAYPDPDCRDLREALSQHLGLELDGILIGNGAIELIHLVARSVLRQGDAAAILAPTFGEFEAACRLQGVAPMQIAPADHRTFRWDLQAAANFLLVRVGDAAAVRLRLLREHRVCVRDCASFGLPEHVRIGVRRMEDCRRLVGALREVMVTSDG